MRAVVIFRRRSVIRAGNVQVPELTTLCVVNLCEIVTSP
jgi:hypothetical protein